jgi:hypothetical protein
MEESPSGAALLAPEPLIYGSLVQVLEGGTVRLAEVRHCHLEGEGYRIGLRILACYHAR